MYSFLINLVRSDNEKKKHTKDGLAVLQLHKVRQTDGDDKLYYDRQR